MKTLLLIAFVTATVGFVLSVIVFCKMVFTKNKQNSYSPLVVDANDPILK